jgi:hypothetical protein
VLTTNSSLGTTGTLSPAFLLLDAPHTGTTFEIVESTGVAVAVLAACLVLAERGRATAALLLPLPKRFRVRVEPAADESRDQLVRHRKVDTDDPRAGRPAARRPPRGLSGATRASGDRRPHRDQQGCPPPSCRAIT